MSHSPARPAAAASGSGNERVPLCPRQQQARTGAVRWQGGRSAAASPFRACVQAHLDAQVGGHKRLQLHMRRGVACTREARPCSRHGAIGGAAHTHAAARPGATARRPRSPLGPAAPRGRPCRPAAPAATRTQTSTPPGGGAAYSHPAHMRRGPAQLLHSGSRRVRRAAGVVAHCHSPNAPLAPPCHIPPQTTHTDMHLLGSVSCSG